MELDLDATSDPETDRKFEYSNRDMNLADTLSKKKELK